MDALVMLAGLTILPPKGKEQEFKDACLLFRVVMASDEVKEELRRLIREGGI